jgi:hypothetical protein
MTLTVLSALARLGIDPWQESARLARLAPGMAVQRLTSIISGMPNGRWAPSNADTIAARLVKLLPAKRTAALPPSMPAASRWSVNARIAMFLCVMVCSCLVLFAINNGMRPAAGVDRSSVSDAINPR